MPEPSGLQRNPEVDYERTDLSLRAVAIVAVGILLLLAVAPLIMIGAFPRARGDVDRHLSITPPEPRLQTDPAADLGAYVRKEQHLLDSYGWIDRNRGIAHIPIEVAMERLARAGIPGFPRAAEPEPLESTSPQWTHPQSTHPLLSQPQSSQPQSSQPQSIPRQSRQPGQPQAPEQKP